MPDVQEVFRMATQKVRPDPGALERQHRDQRRRVIKSKAGVYALVAALVVAGVVVGVTTLRGGGARPGGSVPTPTPTPIPSLVAVLDPLEPGTYVFSPVGDPGFDASHRMTITVPSGYQGVHDYAVVNVGVFNRGVGVFRVDGVYGDPCYWSVALPEPVGPGVGDLVAALANQPGFHATTPTDVTLDGYAGKRMERRAPADIDFADCDEGAPRSWMGRYYEPGERELLWILDVDGIRLVIVAAFLPGTSAQDQAELREIVGSIRID